MSITWNKGRVARPVGKQKQKKKKQFFQKLEKSDRLIKIPLKIIRNDILIEAVVRESLRHLIRISG